MSKFYPVILYPPLILKFLAQNSILPLKNPCYKPNQDHYPIKNNYYINQKNWLSNILVYVFFISVGFIIPCSLILLSPLWLVIIAWALIGLGIFCACTISYTKVDNEKIANYQTSTQTEKKIILHQSQHEDKLRCWLTGKILQPIGLSNATIGVSEKAFYRVLQRVFGTITQGVAFENPQFSYPYSADFVLIHPSSLSIDIEIDEPYVGDTKAPHHCINQGKDDIRNKFFTNSNWVVIRFSEKQVVKYPHSCCKAIAKVIAQVTGDRSYLNSLQPIPDLPPEPMWTIKQAKKWAKEDYRKTYLPVYLH
ncbi:hypothetical protein HCG51_11470 [Tolypothrix sp. PCC 7910]|nr:hypothetical protein HCG51_11470 [Tolypothrix sp. PCC 7910]